MQHRPELSIRAVLALCLLAPCFAAGGDGLGPLDEKLTGVWLQTDEVDEPKTVEITPSWWAVATGGKLQFLAPVIGQRGDEVVVALFCNRVPHHVRLEEDALTVTFTPARTKFKPSPEETTERYVRSDGRPAFFDVSPLALGDPGQALAGERLQSVRAELEERGERDQQVREKFTKPGAETTEDDTRKMRELDEDNTAYLRGLLAEVGWIDAERFGAEVSRAAWLIVQHSGDLQLMQTVLPEIEKQVAAGNEDGGRYALLYDRTQIWLGRKQRFGSQIFFGPDGMFLAPLEEPESIDARRAELGMQPLAEYLELFRERNDGRELPIHYEF